VKKQRVKKCEKRVQEGEEERRNRNRIEDGTLMRRRLRKWGGGENINGGGANKRTQGRSKN